MELRTPIFNASAIFAWDWFSKTYRLKTVRCLSGRVQMASRISDSVRSEAEIWVSLVSVGRDAMHCVSTNQTSHGIVNVDVVLGILNQRVEDHQCVILSDPSFEMNI